MADAAVRDLDELLGEPDRTVRFNGRTWVVPGEMPLELYLRIQQADEIPDAEQEKAIEIMVHTSASLLAYAHLDDDLQPRTDEDRALFEGLQKALRRRSLRFLSRLVWEVYRDPGDEDGAELDAEAVSEEPLAEDPSPVSTAGTTTTS